MTGRKPPLAAARGWLAAVLIALAATLAVAPPAGAFPNGRARAGDLGHVFIPANTAYLSKPAAAAWNTMRLCAIADGVDLYPASSAWRPAATAYRTLGEQQTLWARYRAGSGALAAYPGTSNHGLGHAIDLATPAMRTWVDGHGGKYGWRKTEAFSEWWHVNYAGGFRRPDPGSSLRFPNLRRGSGGHCQAAAVKEVQRRLGLRQDGEYGTSTVRAVRRFQRSRHLHVDGKVGSKTWLQLRKVTRHVRRPRLIGLRPKQVAPMAGQDVTAVQGLLNARFRELHRVRYLIRVTGAVDHRTRVAIKRFQRLRHLPVSGRVDEATYAALLKRLAPHAQTLRVTAEGTRLVASFEGLYRCPYLDPVGIPTQGYGHTAGVRIGNGCWSAAKALSVLHRDLGGFAVQVARLVHVRIANATFNALVSFSFNVGAGALASSTLLQLLNHHHYRAACDQLLRWDRAGGRVLLGLHRRRVAERRLCLKGVAR
jgi:GH24 family phage-related lysozyme (muramidase)/peptidoglycan hydrolase-like protein with peptidoglycan-binding domain